MTQDIEGLKRRLREDDDLSARMEAIDRIELLELALKPFAAYADPRGKMPDNLPITQGSAIAKRQLTMGDCYNARAALEQGE